MTPSLLAAWRARMGWTAKRAAQELGLSVNGYAAYERGWVVATGALNDGYWLSRKPRPIPRHVALACERLEQLQRAS